MQDKFESYVPGLTSPATEHFLITPSDTDDLPYLPRVIYCQIAGNIVVRNSVNVEQTYEMAARDRLDFRAVRVMDTGTSGTFYGWV